MNGNQFDWRAALIRYVMPSRNYTLFFMDEHPEELFNERKEMVIPLRPLNKPFFKLCINSKMIPLPPFMKKWISVKMCEVTKKEWKQGDTARKGTSRSMAKTVKGWYKHKNRSSNIEMFAAWYMEHGQKKTFAEVKYATATPDDIAQIIFEEPKQVEMFIKNQRRGARGPRRVVKDE